MLRRAAMPRSHRQAGDVIKAIRLWAARLKVCRKAVLGPKRQSLVRLDVSAPTGSHAVHLAHGLRPGSAGHALVLVKTPRKNDGEQIEHNLGVSQNELRDMFHAVVTLNWRHDEDSELHRSKPGAIRQGP